MKQTAVEYLVGLLETQKFITKSQIFISQEMEKQQIIDAHIDGFYSPPFGKSRNGEAKDYYDKTFKSE